MSGEYRRVIGRFVALVAIAAVHLALIGLIAISDRLRRAERQEPAREEPLRVILLPSSQPTETTLRMRIPAKLQALRMPGVHEREPPVIREPAAIEVSPAAPEIDWMKEAEAVARARSSGMPDSPACDDTGRPGSALPKCKKSPSSFQWDPEPSWLGVDGLLPYIRLGKRCVFALVFFGCALGELPEANGHLFDDLKDRDGARSSVPEPSK